jgi:hypothetical protein
MVIDSYRRWQANTRNHNQLLWKIAVIMLAPNLQFWQRDDRGKLIWTFNHTLNNKI